MTADDDTPHRITVELAARTLARVPMADRLAGLDHGDGVDLAARAAMLERVHREAGPDAVRALRARYAERARTVGAAAAAAREHAARKRAAALQAEGHSLRAIADALNADGHLAPRGGPWRPGSVARLLRREGTVPA